MGTARLPNWRRKARADFDAGRNIPLLHYSHDNRTLCARFCWVGPLTPVHGRDVIPCSLLCSQAGRRLSQPFMRRPSRMLRPRREMFAAPAASSRRHCHENGVEGLPRSRRLNKANIWVRGKHLTTQRLADVSSETGRETVERCPVSPADPPSSPAWSRPPEVP
jgi:hypothetical protein